MPFRVSDPIPHAVGRYVESYQWDTAKSVPVLYAGRYDLVGYSATIHEHLMACQTFSGGRARGHGNMIPTTRLEQAYYSMTDAVKLSYLLGFFFFFFFFFFYSKGSPTAGEGPRPQFLLFIHWPMWIVENVP